MVRNGACARANEQSDTGAGTCGIVQCICGARVGGRGSGSGQVRLGLRSNEVRSPKTKFGSRESGPSRERVAGAEGRRGTVGG